MKKGLVFFLGILTGAILTIGIIFLLGRFSQTNEDLNTVMFPEPGQVMQIKSLQIMQVTLNGSALAYTSERAKSNTTFYYEPIVLLPGNHNTSFYDNQIIDVPTGKVVRQVGTFKYLAESGAYKTVPIIDIFDK